MVEWIMSSKEEINRTLQQLHKEPIMMTGQRNAYMGGCEYLANQITSEAKRHADEVMRPRRRLAATRRPRWRALRIRLAAMLRRKRVAPECRN